MRMLVVSRSAGWSMPFFWVGGVGKLNRGIKGARIELDSFNLSQATFQDKDPEGKDCEEDEGKI
jgi:hypothetical protein